MLEREHGFKIAVLSRELLFPGEPRGPPPLVSCLVSFCAVHNKKPTSYNSFSARRLNCVTAESCNGGERAPRRHAKSVRLPVSRYKFIVPPGGGRKGHIPLLHTHGFSSFRSYSVWLMRNPGANASELFALLLLTVPSVFTFTKFVALLLLGERSHQLTAKRDIT